MKKFTQLNESVKVDEDKLESLLSKIEGIKYDIYYDYYFHYHRDRTLGIRYEQLTKDIERIVKGDKLTKLVIIDPKVDYTNIDLKGYNDSPLNFDSSLFLQIKDIEDLSNKYNKIFELVKEFKENDPRIIFKDRKIILVLTDKEVTESDLELGNNMKETKIKLYELLNNSGINNIEVVYLRQFNTLYFKIVLPFRHTEDSDDIYKKIVKTIEIHKENKSGREWMKGVEELEDLSDIRMQINELGFYINLKPIKNVINEFEVVLEEI